MPNLNSIVDQAYQDYQGRQPAGTLSYQDVYNATPEGQRELTSSGMSGMDRFLVGAGRELMQLPKAVSQAATYLTGSAEEFAAQQEALQAESELYDRHRPPGIATGAGEFTGMIAPGLIAPAAPGATIGARIGTGAAIGGITATGQPVEEGEFLPEKAKQMGVGSAFGGFFQGGLEAVSGLGKKAMRSFANLTEDADDLSDIADELGIVLRSADVSNNPVYRLIDKGQSMAMMSSVRKQKLAQIEQSLKASRNIQKNLVREGFDADVIGPTIQNSLQRYKDIQTVLSDLNYDRVYKGLGDTVGVANRFVPENVNKVHQQLGFETYGPVYFDVERVPGISGIQDGALQIMRSAREQAEQAMSKGTTKGRSVGSIAKAIETAARKDIDDYLKGAGGRKLVNDFKTAQKNYAQSIAIYKEKFGDLDKMMKSANADQIFAKYVRNKKRGEKEGPKILYEHLTPSGHEAVRYKIMDEAIEAAVKDSGTFNMSAFTRYMHANKGATDVFFQGNDERLLRGMTKLFKHIDRASEVEREAAFSMIMSNPAVYGPLFTGSLVGTSAAELAKATAGRLGFNALFRMFIGTPKGRDFLLELNKAEPGTKVFTSNLSRVLPGAIESYLGHYADDIRAAQQAQQPIFPIGGGA